MRRVAVLAFLLIFTIGLAAVTFSAPDVETRVRSIDDFQGQNAIDDFCDWLNDPGNSWAWGTTTEQVPALNAAAADLEENSPTSNRRFVVFITDDDMENSTQQQRRDLVQRLDLLTGPTGGGVFVSLWEIWEGPLYEHYSQDFTGNPSYPSLAVNGGFDPTSYPLTLPANERYLFANLKARILYGL